MPGPFDMQQQFPIAAVIQAIQRKAELENQQRQQNAQDMLQGLQGLSQGAQSVGQLRRRMAAAQTMSEMPDVQNLLTGNDQPVATSSQGQVTQAQTAAYDPNTGAVTPNVKPNLTAAQIAPLLGQSGKEDYFGDIQKVSSLANMRKRLIGSGTVLTPQIDAQGNVTGYATTQTVPGAHVTPSAHPQRPPAGGGAKGAAQERRDLINLRKQKQDRLLLTTDPLEKAQLQSDIADVDAKLNRIDSFRSPDNPANTPAPQISDQAAIDFLTKKHPGMVPTAADIMWAKGKMRVPF